MDKNKRLTRSRDDRVIAGVAGGLAKYLGTDPSLVRIVFIVGIFVEGITLLIYILMAIIVPEEKKDKNRQKQISSLQEEGQDYVVNDVDIISVHEEENLEEKPPSYDEDMKKKQRCTWILDRHRSYTTGTCSSAGPAWSVLVA